MGNARPVKTVRVKLTDVVPRQVEALEAGDLVDPPGHVGQPAVLEAQAHQTRLHLGEDVLVKVLEAASDDPKVGDGQVPEHPGREVRHRDGEVMELERGHVIPETTPQPRNPILKYIRFYCLTAPLPRSRMLVSKYLNCHWILRSSDRYNLKFD